MSSILKIDDIYAILAKNFVFLVKFYKMDILI